MSKPYCVCIPSDHKYSGLFVMGETLDHDIAWVHGSCGLPTQPIWESYIRRCENCLQEQSLPYEKLCQQCFKEEMKFDPSLSGPWRGWKRAALTIRRALSRPGGANVEEMVSL